MKKKTLLTIVIMVLAKFTIFGQQEPQYTSYMYNMNIVNPAYAGSDEAMNVNFFGRTQWVGIQGAPQTVTFGLHSPVGRNVGLGFSLIADKQGPVREQNAYLDFSYTLIMSDKSKLAFGLKGGFSFVDIALSSLDIVSVSDVAFENRVNKVLPNIGFGLYYYTDQFYAGVSLPNMLKTLHIGKDLVASEVTHYFFTSGYVFTLSDTMKFKPSVLLKAAPGAPVSLDISGNMLFNNNFELGLSYRLDESISALVNFRATRNLRIGYAYDHTLTNLANFNSGSHEVFLLFDFSFVKNQITSPRFF